MIKYFFFCLLLSSCHSLKNNTHKDLFLLTGDTLIYCQANSPWVSSCYYFFKKPDVATNGYFIKKMESDDGQNWSGSGEFVETKKGIVLSPFHLIRSLNGVVQDSTKIDRIDYSKHGNKLIQLGNKKIVYQIFPRHK